MIDPKMIPDEVVNAAIRELDNPAAEEVVGFVEDMRAAIAAGLAKWPKSRRDMLEHWDAWDDEEDCDDTWSEDVLILPLPQEVRDE